MKEKYSQLLKDLSDKELLFHLYVTQVILLIISIVLGFFLFNRLTDFLVLFNISDKNIFVIGGSAGLLVVLIDIVFMKLLPPSLYDDGGLNERIFREKSVLQIAIIAAIVAVCEEILFRGIIQTYAGLVISSVIFAAVHYRYLFNWFLFVNVIVLSFFIGYIFLITENLFVTIFMHFLIDFILGLVIKYRHKTTGRDAS